MIERSNDAEPRLRYEIAALTLMLNKENILGYSGHVSARLPGQDTLLIQPVDHSRAELKPEHLILCDLDGHRLAGPDGERPPGEIHIHTEIYKARPDIGAIAHFHHDLATTFSVVEGASLAPIKNHAARWESGIPVHPDPRHVNTPALGRALAGTLGKHHAAMIRAHGQVIVSENLQALLMDCVHFVENAEALFRAMTIGRVLPLTAEEMAVFHASFKRRKHANKLWTYYVGRGYAENLLPRAWTPFLEVEKGLTN